MIGANLAFLIFVTLIGAGAQVAAATMGQRIVKFSYETAPLICNEARSSTCEPLPFFDFRSGDRVTMDFVISERAFGGALNGQVVSFGVESDGQFLTWSYPGASDPDYGFPDLSFDPPPWLLGVSATQIRFPPINYGIYSLEIDENLRVADWSIDILSDPKSFESQPGQDEFFEDTRAAPYLYFLFDNAGAPGRWRTAVIPLPASLPLMLGCLALLGGVAARARSA